MKQLAMVAGVALVGFLAWFMLSQLSSDALGMAVGVVFGVLAGIPSALLVLASSRPHDDDDDDDDDYGEASLLRTWHQPFPYQPPVIVLAAPVEDKPQVVNNYTDNRSVTIHAPGNAQTMPLITDRQREIAAERGGRVFRVVGEREEWE